MLFGDDRVRVLKEKKRQTGDIYWPAKERLQNIDAVRSIVKTKNLNCRT